MLVQRVLDWISPREKSEEIGEENEGECVEPPDVSENPEEMQTVRIESICSSSGPDRNNADEIERELLQSHSEKLPAVAFLEKGDICKEKQQQSNKKVDFTTGHVRVDRVVECPRVPKLSPLCKRILQQSTTAKRPSRRSIFTQTDGKKRGRKSTRRNSSTSKVEQKTRNEKDVTTSKNNQLKSKENTNFHKSSTSPTLNSVKKTKAMIDIHSSDSRTEPVRSTIQSRNKTKGISVVHTSESPKELIRSVIHSPEKTKDLTSIHSSETPKEQLRNEIHSINKSKENTAFHNSEGSTKSQKSSLKKTTRAISVRNSEKLFRRLEHSPKISKGVTFMHNSESPNKEPLKSVIYSPKRTEEINDNHTSAIHSLEIQKNQLNSAIHFATHNSEVRTGEKIATHGSESPHDLVSSIYSSKKTKDQLDNHNAESLKEKSGSGSYSSSETEAVDFNSGTTPLSSKEEESVISSRVMNILREVAEQYPKDKSMDSEVYGELLVLGTSNRFVLRRRAKANGVKEAASTSSQITNTRKGNVSFQVSSASRSVVVQYVRDPTTDMFQLGRYEHLPIDICVRNSDGRKGVSRFACRLVIKRQNSRDARLYAAAFNSSGNVFLGESGLCKTDGKSMDGFTTNGVLLQQPGSEWREVSVRGHLYSLRTELGCRRRIESESNVLRDGTLIDLCGITLLWRTHEGISDTPGEDCLIRMESLLRELAPVCRNKIRSLTGKVQNGCGSETFVFLSCGHVVSMEASPEEGMVCPECGRVGPVTILRVSKERGFYIDSGMPPSHAFRPCGHVSTHGTVRYWSEVGFPYDRRKKGICPFCGTRLYPLHKYVGIVYPKHCRG